MRGDDIQLFYKQMIDFTKVLTRNFKKIYSLENFW